MTEPRRPDLSPLLPDEAALAAKRRALVAELEPSPGRPRRVKRRLVLVLAAMLALGGGVAWAAGVFSADEVALENGIGCYSEPRLQGPELAVTVVGAGADPVAKCGKLWSEGVVDSRGGPASPELVACSKPDQGVFVFPGDPGLCARLGLEPLPADFAPAGREAARAYTAWTQLIAAEMQEIPAGECRSPEAVAAAARKRLEGTGYQDIRVEVVGDRPCASYVNPHGSVIAVLTRTRGEDEAQALGGRAADALSRLLDRAIDECVSPAEFERLAEAALELEGLGKVGVKVWRPEDPCTGGSYGFSPHPPTVELSGDSRKTWEGNRAGYHRAERAWERRGYSLDGN